MTYALLNDTYVDTFPVSPTPNIKSNEVIYLLHNERTATDKAYTDLTGRFPFSSGRGHQYVLIGYHIDSNAILQRAIKNRTAVE